MMNIKHLSITAISIALIVLSCSKPDDDPPELTAIEKLVAGWTHYEADRIIFAKDLFLEVKTDANLGGEALSGLAWCSNALSQLDSTQIYVYLAMNAGYAEYDMPLLLAAVQLADGLFSEAIATLDALEISSTWVFEHNTDVNYQDFVLIQGYANYHLGYFAVTAENIQLLDSGIQIDIDDNGTWVYKGSDYDDLGVMLLAILNDFSGVLT